MIVINNVQKNYLVQHGIAVEKYIIADDIDSLLEAIDDAVVENIVTHNDEPDETGIKLQRIYDEINNQNE